MTHKTSSDLAYFIATLMLNGLPCNYTNSTRLVIAQYPMIVFAILFLKMILTPFRWSLALEYIIVRCSLAIFPLPVHFISALFLVLLYQIFLLDKDFSYATLKVLMACLSFLAEHYQNIRIEHLFRLMVHKSINILY